MKLAHILGGVAIVAGVAWAVASVFEEHWYLGSIPPQIRTAGALRISGKTDFIRSGCGVAIFNLAEETQDAIRTQGLKFLESVRTAERHSYEPWQETPVRPELLAGMGCANLRRSLSDKIFEGVVKPGSYVTLAGQSTLLVIPDAKLVVFSYLD